METMTRRCVDLPPAPAGHGLAGVCPHEPHTELLLAGLRPGLVTLVQPQVCDGQAPQLQIWKIDKINIRRKDLSCHLEYVLGQTGGQDQVLNVRPELLCQLAPV